MDDQPLLLQDPDVLQERLQVDVSQRLGGGACARVYLARFDGQAAALKVMHPSLGRKDELVAAFLKEAACLFRSPHENVIHVLAVCYLPPAFSGLPTRRHTWALVLEVAKHGPLSKVIGTSMEAHALAAMSFTSEVAAPAAGQAAPPDAKARSPAVTFLDPPSQQPQQPALYSDVTAVRWCLGIARALESLHTQQPPVIHRDVKPDNILLVEHEEASQRPELSSVDHATAKLADFGMHVVLDGQRPGHVTPRVVSAIPSMTRSMASHLTSRTASASHSRRPSHRMRDGATLPGFGSGGGGSAAGDNAERSSHHSSTVAGPAPESPASALARRLSSLVPQPAGTLIPAGGSGAAVTASQQPSGECALAEGRRSPVPSGHLGLWQGLPGLDRDGTGDSGRLFHLDSAGFSPAAGSPLVSSPVRKKSTLGPTSSRTGTSRMVPVRCASHMLLPSPPAVSGSEAEVHRQPSLKVSRAASLVADIIQFAQSEHNVPSALPASDSMLLGDRPTAPSCTVLPRSSNSGQLPVMRAASTSGVHPGSRSDASVLAAALQSHISARLNGQRSAGVSSSSSPRVSLSGTSGRQTPASPGDIHTRTSTHRRRPSRHSATTAAPAALPPPPVSQQQQRSFLCRSELRQGSLSSRMSTNTALSRMSHTGYRDDDTRSHAPTSSRWSGPGSCIAIPPATQQTEHTQRVQPAPEPLSLSAMLAGQQSEPTGSSVPWDSTQPPSPREGLEPIMSTGSVTRTLSQAGSPRGASTLSPLHRSAAASGMDVMQAMLTEAAREQPPHAPPGMKSFRGELSQEHAWPGLEHVATDGENSPHAAALISHSAPDHAVQSLSPANTGNIQSLDLEADAPQSDDTKAETQGVSGAEQTQGDDDGKRRSGDRRAASSPFSASAARSSTVSKAPCDSHEHRSRRGTRRSHKRHSGRHRLSGDGERHHTSHLLAPVAQAGTWDKAVEGVEKVQVVFPTSANSVPSASAGQLPVSGVNHRHSSPHGAHTSYLREAPSLTRKAAHSQLPGAALLERKPIPVSPDDSLGCSGVTFEGVRIPVSNGVSSSATSMRAERLQLSHLLLDDLKDSPLGTPGSATNSTPTRSLAQHHHLLSLHPTSGASTQPGSAAQHYLGGDSVAQSLAQQSSFSHRAPSHTTSALWSMDSESHGWSQLRAEGISEVVYALTGNAGTALYMAPEVAREDLYNEKSDVYSFAIVMYEVMGRTLLLAGRSRAEVEYLSSRVQSGYRPRRLEAIELEGVWQLITWCWAQEPSHRPSMTQVVQRLALIHEELLALQSDTTSLNSDSASGAVSHTPVQRSLRTGGPRSNAASFKSSRGTLTSMSHKSRGSRGTLAGVTDDRGSNTTGAGALGVAAGVGTTAVGDVPRSGSIAAPEPVDAILEPPAGANRATCGCCTIC